MVSNTEIDVKITFEELVAEDEIDRAQMLAMESRLDCIDVLLADRVVVVKPSRDKMGWTTTYMPPDNLLESVGAMTFWKREVDEHGD